MVSNRGDTSRVPFLVVVDGLANPDTGQWSWEVTQLDSDGACVLDSVVYGGTHPIVLGVKHWVSDNLPLEKIPGAMESGTIDGSYAVVAVGDAVRMISDPLGTVPMFYSVCGTRIVIGMNVQEVARMAGRGLDEQSIWKYLVFDYVPQPDTLFSGVRRCPPGTTVRVGPLDMRVDEDRYFGIADYIRTYEPKNDDPADEIANVWHSSILRVLGGTDLKGGIGVSLSGGLDSRFLLACLRKLDVPCFAYTYSTREDASDVQLARRVAETLGVRCEVFVVHPHTEQMIAFSSRLAPMEPVAMSFLSDLAPLLRHDYGLRNAMVAHTGDVIWGSHSSFKHAVKATKSALPWRRYCTSWCAAWVAGSELGSWAWASHRNEWTSALDLAGTLLSDTVDRTFDISTAERLWSISYRQPSFTWNSNLVYLDAGISVLAPTLTLESIAAGMSLPKSAAFAGCAYERALLKHHPSVATLPLTRTRTRPTGRVWRAVYSDLALGGSRLLRTDRYVPFIRFNDWYDQWQSYGAGLSQLDGEVSDWPESVQARLWVIQHLSQTFSGGGALGRLW